MPYRQKFKAFTVFILILSVLFLSSCAHLSNQIKHLKKDPNKIYIGMSEDEVIKAFGNPAVITQTVTGSGVLETWQYNTGNYPFMILLLVNGQVMIKERL